MEPSASASNAELYLVFRDEDGPIFLDNVSFYEADVQMEKPEDHILFDYSTAKKTVNNLTGWINLKGEPVNQYILEPYSSIILIRSLNPPFKSKI